MAFNASKRASPRAWAKAAAKGGVSKVLPNGTRVRIGVDGKPVRSLAPIVPMRDIKSLFYGRPKLIKKTRPMPKFPTRPLKNPTTARPFTQAELQKLRETLAARRK